MPHREAGDPVNGQSQNNALVTNTSRFSRRFYIYNSSPHVAELRVVQWSEAQCHTKGKPWPVAASLVYKIEEKIKVEQAQYYWEYHR